MAFCIGLFVLLLVSLIVVIAVMFSDSCLDFYLMLQPPSLGCVTGCSDGIVCCWDLLKGSCLHVLDEHTDSIVRVSCTPKMVTSMGADCTIRVWDRTRGTEVNVISLVSCSKVLYECSAVGSITCLAC